MRRPIALLLTSLLGSAVGTSFAGEAPRKPELLHVTSAPHDVASGVGTHGAALKDIPPDTLDFGFYTTKMDGKKYAIPGGMWTWDHGAQDPFEGWTDVDMTSQIGTFFRHMTAWRWAYEGNGGPPPAMDGNGFVLCGTRKGFADSLGWVGGVGYGNGWCQTLTSPVLHVHRYDFPITVLFDFFIDSEVDSDCLVVILEVDGQRYRINDSPPPSGHIGIDPVTGVITPMRFSRTLTDAVFPNYIEGDDYRIVLMFGSGLEVSDEDGGLDSWYGAVGIDNFLVQYTPPPPWGQEVYDFEWGGLQGWTPGACPGVGSFFGVAGPFAAYNILDPCPCALTGSVAKLHDELMAHPDGQHVGLYTPIIDREEDIPGGNYLAYNRVLADWDQYSDLPLTNGVFYRPGWIYYPYENPNVPDMSLWSPRVGISTFYYMGGSPSCLAMRSIATDWGLPVDARQIKFMYELYASCGAFGIGSCSGVSNFSPLIDNVRVRNVGRRPAPVALFSVGGKFQDGFGQSPVGILNTGDAGNANAVYNLRCGSAWPTRLGDSLVVEGPCPTPGVAAARWEAKLWFHLNRTGPGQLGNALYNHWHSDVVSQKGPFVGADAGFAWGYMDSVEVGTSVKANSSSRFCSRFRDGPSTGGFMLPADANYNWGGTGEFGNGNAILPDLCFTPGTKVQYFITSNYVPTPDVSEYLPDTTGKNYFEFEILPSFRTIYGVDQFPCMLYIDAYDEDRESPTAQFIIEKALNRTMNGLFDTEPIPDPTKWDRYDYGDAPSSWSAPFYRDVGGNAGATMPQMLGYKLIMVNTGLSGPGCMWSRDWQGFTQWMEGVMCDGNATRQGFIANGNSVSEIIAAAAPSFLAKNLGAVHSCGVYNAYGCPPGETQNDEHYCTKLVQGPGPFGAGIPTDVWGNWCPERRSFGVLAANSAVPAAVGNKYYEKIGAPGVTARWAQVINDQLATQEAYRTVVDDFSYHMLIAPNPAASPPLSANECRYSTPTEATTARISAAAKELENAIQWTMGSLPGFCTNPCLDLTDVPDQDGAPTAVNRLFQNRPNPFNPRTAIRFSLAADGPAKLVIYDVSGRCIRTLLDSGQKAGTHEVVWDGTDDFGHVVTSGVYWSRLTAGAYSSNKKMVVLK